MLIDSSQKADIEQAVQDLGYELAERAAAKFSGEPFAPGYKRNREEFRKVVTQEGRIKRAVRIWQKSVVPRARTLVDWTSVTFGQPKAIDSAWQTLEDELVNILIKELTPAVQSGIRYGSDQLKVPVTIDAESSKGFQKVKKRARFAAQSITKTMRDRFLTRLKKQAQAAQVMPVDQELEDELLGGIEDREKSEQIAQTEVVAAVILGLLLYGNFVREESEKLEGRDIELIKQWETLRDPSVCPICTDLSGEQVDVDDEFDSMVGNVDGPPDPHPQCRCFLVIALKRD